MADEFIHGDFVVCSMFNPTKFPGARCLGVPRANNGDFGAYRALAVWLMSKKIKAICGQVLSGAQMAHTVALAANGEIIPVYLKKDGYEPRCHFSSSYIPTPYAIIDDIVSSGRGMRDAIREAKFLAEGGEDPEFIIAHQMYQIPEAISFIPSEKFYAVVRHQ